MRLAACQRVLSRSLPFWAARSTVEKSFKAHAGRHWGHILWSRMRPFVLLLLSAYALGTLVFWSIPATGEQGTFHMSFLDALYMVAITGTTIGFGEFPVPFNAAQRGFVLVIYYFLQILP